MYIVKESKVDKDSFSKSRVGGINSSIYIIIPILWEDSLESDMQYTWKISGDMVCSMGAQPLPFPHIRGTPA